MFTCAILSSITDDSLGFLIVDVSKVAWLVTWYHNVCQYRDSDSCLIVNTRDM